MPSSDKSLQSSLRALVFTHCPGNRSSVNVACLNWVNCVLENVNVCAFRLEVERICGFERVETPSGDSPGYSVH